MHGIAKRDLENTIKKLLGNFPCVSLLGARQVGKSTLTRQVLPKAKFFDLEKNSDFERINNPESLALILKEKKSCIVFDEAQLCPNLFSQLRVAIDENRKQNGQFLISGSSSPELLKNITESLAGRVAIVEVPTLAWHEALERKQSKIYDLFRSPEKFKKLKPIYSRQELLELCLYGLYPEPFFERANSLKYKTWQESYIKSYLERDIRALFPQLRLDSYQKFIRMLCTSSGELLKASNFAKSLDVSEPTIKNYMNIAEGTFIWRKLNPYSKNSNKRLIKMPKGFIRDSLIKNYFLNINSIEDLEAHPNFGNTWESFIMEQIFKNLNSKSIRYFPYFYRTHHQAEIDLVLESEFGLIPIEIKSGAFTKNTQLINLKNFIEEYNCSYGIVINNADTIEMLSEKIYQIPAVYI
jgi:uncharacterized protein